MPREFQCQCGRKFRVRDDYAGKKARCPECAAVVRVPDLAPPAAAPAPPSPAPAPAPAAIPTVEPVPIPPPLGRKAGSEAAEGPVLDLAALNLRIEPESEPPPRGAAAAVPEAAPIEAEPAGPAGRGRERRGARAATAAPTAPVPAAGLRAEPWFYQVLHLAALIVVVLAVVQFTLVLGLVLGGLAGRGPLAPPTLPDGSTLASARWGLISGLVSSGVVLAVTLVLSAPVFLLVDVARNIRRSTGALLAMADAQGR